MVLVNNATPKNAEAYLTVEIKNNLMLVSAYYSVQGIARPVKSKPYDTQKSWFQSFGVAVFFLFFFFFCLGK